MTNNTSTAWDCEKDGHDWHEGTAVGSRYCPRCGKYIQDPKPFHDALYVYNGRYHVIPEGGEDERI